MTGRSAQLISLARSVTRTALFVGLSLIVILVLLPAALVAAGPVLFTGGGPAAT